MNLSTGAHTIIPFQRKYPLVLYIFTLVSNGVSHFTPFDTRVNMYNALVVHYFNYCSAVWGNINSGLADKLPE